jgi:hypothetical protein
MKYTNKEIHRALSLAVDCLDAAHANEKEAFDRSDTKLDALSKAGDVLIALISPLGRRGVDRIAPTFGDKNDPII